MQKVEWLATARRPGHGSRPASRPVLKVPSICIIFQVSNFTESWQFFYDQEMRSDRISIRSKQYSHFDVFRGDKKESIANEEDKHEETPVSLQAKGPSPDQQNADMISA